MNTPIIAPPRRSVDPGFRVWIDNIDPDAWHQALASFDDANFYQTWGYGRERWRRSRLSHLILERGGRAAAMAQVRILGIPRFAGIAYVRWPLWKRSGEAEDPLVFRQMARTLAAEYVGKRRLLLRLLPRESDARQDLAQILQEEEFKQEPSRYNTVRVDLTPTLEEIRRRFPPRWRTDLNRSERNGLRLVEGTGPDFYERFATVYVEMFERKRLDDHGDLDAFRRVQAALPPHLKPKIMLCEHDGAAIAGAITSPIGKEAIAILWATNEAGRKQLGAYFLQWNIITWLKNSGCLVYDLGGVSQEQNPGGYRFKCGIAGANASDVRFLGEFVASACGVSSAMITGMRIVQLLCSDLRQRITAVASQLAIRDQSGVDHGRLLNS